MSLEKKRILDTWKLVNDALTPFKGQVNLCPISIITLTTVHVMSILIYSLSLVSYAVYAILGRRRQHRLEGRQQYLVLFGAATSSGPYTLLKNKSCQAGSGAARRQLESVFDWYRRRKIYLHSATTGKCWYPRGVLTVVWWEVPTVVSTVLSASTPHINH